MSALDRPWTKRVTTEARVEVYHSGYFGFRRDRDLETSVQELAQDVKRLFKEHADWRGVDVTISRTTEVQCTFCGREYEEDIHGPVCCDRAITAFNMQTSELPK